MGLLGQDFVSRITGSALADEAARTITAPEGQAIIAIQFLAESTLSSLIAKEPTRDINTAVAAHSTGRFTRTVDGSVSSAAKVVFDQENADNGGIKPGDKIYSTVGVLLATVLNLDPDGNNTKEISTVANFSVSDGATVVFTRPTLDNSGVGGAAINASGSPTNNKFPAGMTINGAWESVSLASDDTDGGIIVYFGQYK